MSTSRCTIIYFDHGGYSKEGDDMKWISAEDEIHSLAMKTSLEEVNYSVLVERICRKLMMDEATTQLKISYFPLVLNPKRPTYIWNDEDVFCYLFQVNKDQCRSLLHVEFSKDVNQSQRPVEALTEDHETYGDKELVSSGREGNDCMITVYTGEPSEYHEMHDHGTDGASGYEQVYEDSEVRPTAGDEHAHLGWDDGIDMVIGQEFGSKEAVQTLVQRASHQNCFEYDTIKSDTKRYVIKCCGAKDGCKWSVRAAKHKNSDRFMISTYNKLHTCSRVTTTTSRNRRKGTRQLVASVLAEDYPGRFDTPTPKVLMEMVQGRIGVSVSYSTALRGKNLAANEVRGSPEESYRMLYPYLHMLEYMNPGTRTCVEVDEGNRFKYLFFALGACIEGFQMMRKVIIVDGTHLKNVYGGVLIVATAQDPNHHHYLVAFGVVDGEKEASWMWFFNQLKAVIPDHPEMVFISGRNPGLIKSIREVFPSAKHGYCIWHLSQNVKLHVANHRDKCTEKFRECAHAYTECDFLTLYGAFKNKYPGCAVYLGKSVKEKFWARCYFPGQRYNIDTTNCAESINGVFREAKKYSLLPMIDVIVAKLSEWWNEHRNSSAKIPTTQKLVPLVETVMSKRCAIGKTLTTVELNSFGLEYKVTGRDRKPYLVDLHRRTCSCKYFDIDRYPCEHAIAAVVYVSRGKDLHLQDFCSKYYLVEQWVLAYSRTIYPVPHMSDWIIPDDVRAKEVLPPHHEIKRGRKQQTRFPSVGEHRGRRRGRGRGRGLGRMYEWFVSGENES